MRYVNDDFETAMLNKIDNAIPLTEEELRELVFGWWDVDDERGEKPGRLRTVTTIVQLAGRTFAIKWEEGLVEGQKNEFLNQPYEVRLRTYQRAVTVKRWVAFNEGAPGSQGFEHYAGERL